MMMTFELLGIPKALIYEEGLARLLTLLYKIDEFKTHRESVKKIRMLNRHDIYSTKLIFWIVTLRCM